MSIFALVVIWIEEMSGGIGVVGETNLNSVKGDEQTENVAEKDVSVRTMGAMEAHT